MASKMIGMQMINWPGSGDWTAGQRIIFRFLFLYCVMSIAPWNVFAGVPGVDRLLELVWQAEDWLVNAAESFLFRAYGTLVPPNGSGDTSWAYTRLKLCILIAAAGTVLWSLPGRNRKQYDQAAYWLRIILRFTLCLNCFGYGFAKVFLQQMPFPNLSQLATPLGDLLPMRLSWMFIGYSATYQFFTGAVEVLAGVMLFFRRTTTLGTLLAAGIFANVFMINIGYDVPVKLFSLHLLLYAFILLSFESRRLIQFFWKDTTAEPSRLYDVRFPLRWQRICRLALKGFVAVYAVLLPLREGLFPSKPPSVKFPIGKGIYAVELFVRNGDTIPHDVMDTLRWQDMIFEDNGSGSVGTKDSIFRQLYGRGYFQAVSDSAMGHLSFSKRDAAFNNFPLFSLAHEQADSGRHLLHGRVRGDSVRVVLVKKQRHFQLAERQFHWLSEYNR